MWEDPIVAEVRRIREEIFAGFGYDLEAYAAHIITLQEEDKKQGVKYASPRPGRSILSEPDAAA